MLMECSKTQGNELWTQPPQLHLFYEKPWKRKLQHYGRETNFFVKGFKETLSFENMHLKETHFLMYVKKWKHDLKKKKKKRKDFWKHILYILFWSFGSPKRKREKELFSENKVSDTPLFFRKHFFFFKRFWKKFSYDFWKQILKTAFRKQYLKNRFYFMQKTIFLLTQKTVFLYSAENSFYTVQKREKTDLNDSVIKQIFLLEN